MRRRLLVSTLMISVLTVLVLGIPLSLVARHEVWSAAREVVRREATTVAAGIEDRLDAGLPVDLTRYAAGTRNFRIVVTDPPRQAVISGPELAGPITQFAVTVGAGTVTVQASQRPTSAHARTITLVILGLGLLAVSGAVTLSTWQARRLAEPLAALAIRADALGHGEFGPRRIVSGITEIDQISRELERSAERIATTMDLQRNFAGDAAHQLRTPLTGIGLRLDEILDQGNADVRAEAVEAIAQVERLNRVIGALLARALDDAAPPSIVELDLLVRSETASWGELLRAQGRRLILRSQTDLLLWARREHVASILDCLLENALIHAAGDVTLTTWAVGGQVQVRVTDEGPGIPAAQQEHIFQRRFSNGNGTGIGLALARSLAAAEGGVLRCVADAHGRFVLTLPSSDRVA